MIGKEVYLEETKDAPNWFIDGRTARIKLGNKELGYVGEIHPKILKNWRIKMPAALLEIDLSEILQD